MNEWLSNIEQLSCIPEIKPTWLYHISRFVNPDNSFAKQDPVMWQDVEDVEEIKIDLSGMYKTHYAVSVIVIINVIFK